jgi:hypothetical protein
MGRSQEELVWKKLLSGQRNLSVASTSGLIYFHRFFLFASIRIILCCKQINRQYIVTSLTLRILRYSVVLAIFQIRHGDSRVDAVLLGTYFVSSLMILHKSVDLLFPRAPLTNPEQLNMLLIAPSYGFSLLEDAVVRVF